MIEKYLLFNKLYVCVTLVLHYEHCKMYMEIDIELIY